MNYYKGKYNIDYEKEFSQRKGWLVGPFMNEKQNNLRGTKSMAIKFWKFKKNTPTGHAFKYQRFATECTFIFKGKLKAIIDSGEFEFIAGDYVVLPPNVVSNLAIEVIEDSEGLTIKAPSFIPDDTVKL